MISDFVKGKKKFDYPTEVQQGISLHRDIDSFTDSHEATKEAKEYFRPDYRLYSGAFIDIVYDHFLANDEEEFSEATLFDFSKRTYATLDQQAGWMPERFAHMFPYMKQQNWLYNYHTRWGIKKSFGGLVRRSAYLSDSHTAFDLFEKHYQPLGDCYRHFWAALKPYAKNKFDELTGNKI
jgi:acyl carrier protein phosphodiesterase